MAKPTRAEKKAAKRAAKQAKKDAKLSKETGYHYYRTKNGKILKSKTKYDTLPEGASYIGNTKKSLEDYKNKAKLEAQTQKEKDKLAGNPTGIGKWWEGVKGTFGDAATGAKQFAFGVPPQELHFDMLTPDQKAAFTQQYLPYLREQIAASQGKTLEDFSQGFDPFANKMRQDYARSIPSIAERFGIGGERGTSFMQALQSGQGDLESNIQAQRAQFGLQNRQNQWGNTLGALGYAFQPQIENAYIPRQPGFLENIAAAGAGGLGKAAGMSWFGA